ncbi:hypothetical protein [Tahibacter caeni]|uniref:hypothetical protein n=1 Tax=Tahibacter caeni TaxID=1453545 RepID=UPI00214976D0|nr:hypothetical protein [Tahibacter caeni]
MSAIQPLNRSPGPAPSHAARCGSRSGTLSPARRLALIAWLALIAAAPTVHGAPPVELCKALRAFVASVRPGETREFTFRTAWGSNFDDAAEPAISAKRCEHAGHAPAEKVCAYLMEHGSVEFSGRNVEASITCLSRDTRFDRALNLYSGAFSFGYGAGRHSAQIDVSFGADTEAGGMAFRLAAKVY